MPTQSTYTAVALPADTQTIDAADVTTDLTGLINEYNLNIGNSKIDAAAAIVSSKLADGNAFTPVGGIVMYWSTGAAAPSNWVYCDGSVISDVASTLNGKTTPNIMGSKFVRGVANSNLQSAPSNGGSNTYALATHDHTWATTDGSGDMTSGDGQAVHQNNQAVAAAGTAFAQRPNLSKTFKTAASGSATVDTVPAYIGMTYIMRIK